MIRTIKDKICMIASGRMIRIKLFVILQILPLAIIQILFFLDLVATNG